MDNRHLASRGKGRDTKLLLLLLALLVANTCTAQHGSALSVASCLIRVLIEG
jgi:hypothetical protein